MRHYQPDPYGNSKNFYVQFNTIFTPGTFSRRIMSWLFGIISRDVSPKTRSQCDAIHGVPLKSFTKNGSYHFSIGGLQSTCLFGETLNSQNEIDTFWFTLGVTFAKIGSKRTLLSQDDWNAVNGNGFKDLDGHFVHAFYENERYEFHTDRIGLRTLYWAKAPGAVIISTRIDWLAKFLGNCRIQFETLGSRWLTFNQISYESIIERIHRLGPSGKLVVDRDGVFFSQKPFEPSFSGSFSVPASIEQLRECVIPTISDQLEPTLGLSGGLDSRVLLALMLRSDNRRFHTHSFGNRSEPDVSIPERMSRECGFRHISYESPLPTIGETLQLINTYAAETNLVEPVSTVLRLRDHSVLNPATQVLVDGAFGELVRRKYLSRFVLNGRRAIGQRNITVIFKNLQIERADIFTREVTELMTAGVKKEIEEMLETMPDIERIGIDNYLDLWAVRARLPNYSCDAQARLDSFLLNFMPFAQSSYIDTIFDIPVRYRRNAVLFREIIKQNAPSLAKYPLVKINTTHPFSLPSLATILLSKAKIRLGYQYNDESVHVFLELMKEFLLDLMHSKETIEYPAYEYKKIAKKVQEYYAGAKNLSGEINWWLTFELWRRNFAT
jgi:Asparagine synthase